MDPRPGALIRWACAPEAPWGGAGGRTRQLHADGGWRLSVATIPASDRFTALPGRDRTLLLARGELRLAIDGGRPRRLTPGQHVSFPGEAHVVSEPVGGPAVALNVMVERGRRTASVQSAALDGHAPSAAAVVLLTGAAHLHGEELQAFDAVLGPATTDVCGAGACVAVISLSEGQP